MTNASSAGMPMSQAAGTSDRQFETESHLAYLDGLRGLAALYVVLHHTYLGISASIPASWQASMGWAWNGQIAVQIFIVLSGYCLMIPIAKSGGLRRGWLGFMRRRAMRILPPYYAALALALGTIAVLPEMNTPERQMTDPILPAFTTEAIVSHLLLIQDFSKQWISKICGPMWTIAQEWQIYFVFALVLVPLWRRSGMLAAFAVATAITLLLHYFPGHDFRYAAPQFLLLFAVGMWAAAIHFKRVAIPSSRELLLWGTAAIALWLVHLGSVLHRPVQENFTSLRLSLVEAAAMMCTLSYCTLTLRTGRRRNLAVRILQSRAAVLLGPFPTAFI